jgi:hypothetical protein
MPTFEVILRDGAVEIVDGADAYQQEGPLTTFFRRGHGRDVIDSWSIRMASYRTADLAAVRRREPAVGAADVDTPGTAATGTIRALVS